MSVATVTSYATRFHMLHIDGFPNAGFIKSVEGGAIKGDLITQQIGGQSVRVKQLGNRSIDPFTIQVGMSMIPHFWTWVKKSWDGDVQRFNGSVMSYDASMKLMHEMQFRDALIVETTMPGLDAQQGAPLYLGVKFQAENLVHKVMPGGKAVVGAHPPKQKVWQQSNFHFKLDGVNCGNVTKVESFAVKQNVKPVPTGPEGLYQYEPTQLEYGNLTITTALASAKELFDWAQTFIIEGKSSAKDEKNGSLTLLSPHLRDELLTFHLKGVGITSLTVDKADVGAKGTKMVKAELYVERMELDHNSNFVIL